MIPSRNKVQSRAKRIIRDSGHEEAGLRCHNFPENAGKAGKTESVQKSIDLHQMLKIIFKSYVELQEKGFIWDLQYRGTVYKDVEFVLFCPFFKLDTDEADKICG